MIAKTCGYSYWYTVGDPEHLTEIGKLEPYFVPKIADNVELDSTNCLQPPNK